MTYVYILQSNQPPTLVYESSDPANANAWATAAQAVKRPGQTVVITQTKHTHTAANAAERRHMHKLKKQAIPDYVWLAAKNLCLLKNQLADKLRLTAGNPPLPPDERWSVMMVISAAIAAETVRTENELDDKQRPH